MRITLSREELLIIRDHLDTHPYNRIPRSGANGEHRKPDNNYERRLLLSRINDCLNVDPDVVEISISQIGPAPRNQEAPACLPAPRS